MQLLGALGKIKQSAMPLVVSHQSIIPVIDIYASTQMRDLGAISDAVRHVVAENEGDLPRGSRIEIRGQGVTMTSAYIQLVGGLLFSIVLVYLVIVVNFQSWLDPFIIITALPGALAGIAWSLFLTHTTLSVPALTGAIMCMGTATANSILVVSFARERLAIHGNAVRAAIEAGYGRVRPVADDRAGDDHRDAADELEQHPERGVGPGGHGRPGRRDAGDPAVRADDLRPAAWPGTQAGYPSASLGRAGVMSKEPI